MYVKYETENFVKIQVMKKYYKRNQRTNKASLSINSPGIRGRPKRPPNRKYPKNYKRNAKMASIILSTPPHVTEVLDLAEACLCANFEMFAQSEQIWWICHQI